ncbi:MAG TPA: polysaccharide deacetylase family protein [Anaerolineales bacterium]|nr:polysaccharide deacetylase family protein [Anaerolineales bacterium]
MKKSYLCVVFTLVAMTACMFVQRQAAFLLSEPSNTPLPTEILALLTTSTATALPIITPSATATETVVPTETPRPDIAPTLPHTDVHFIYHGDRNKRFVALTFDLCQKPEYPAWFDQGIYDVLTRYDVPATFFMGGDWMRTHVNETLLLASNAKFELGNHSWSHPDLPGMSEEAISSEIVKTQDMLYKLTGRQAKLFRLPSGLSDDLSLSVIALHGLYTIQWDVETGDPDPNIDAKRINREVEQVVQNGSIIIMHANGRGWHTAEALPQMIEYLQGQGYTLVTVSQLLGLEPIPNQ